MSVSPARTSTNIDIEHFLAMHLCRRPVHDGPEVHFGETEPGRKS